MNNVTDISRDIVYPDEYLISGVPDYQQTTVNGLSIMCIPTSMTNILAYWYNHGFPDLVLDNTDNIEDYIKINIYSYLLNNGGTTSNDYINPSFEDYVEYHSDYRYYGYGISWSSYVDLQAEIYSFENPCLIGFPELYGGGHMTTGVGYDNTSSTQKVIVHDNHWTTSRDVSQPWSEVDFPFSFEISEPW